MRRAGPARAGADGARSEGWAGAAVKIDGCDRFDGTIEIIARYDIMTINRYMTYEIAYCYINRYDIRYDSASKVTELVKKALFHIQYSVIHNL